MTLRPAIALFAFSLSCGTSFVNKTELESDSGTPEPQPSDSGEPSSPDDTSAPEDTAVPPEPINAKHPRLFFSLSDVPRLQAQIYDFERAEVVTTWDRYVSDLRDSSTIPLSDGASPPTTESGWGELVAPLPSMAMYALFTDDADILSNTLEWMHRVVELDTWGDSEVDKALTLQGICIAYDMLHDKMDATNRVETRRRIIETAASISASVSDASPWAQRDNQILHSALLMAGVVTEHDYDTSAEWLAQARTFFNRTFDQLQSTADGSWPEGPSTASEVLTHTYQAWQIMERHYGMNLNDSTWLQSRGQAMLRLARPGLLDVMPVGDGLDTWVRGPEHQTCFVDAHSTDRTATWIRQEHILVETGTSRKHDLWLEFLWCDPSWVPTPPSESTSPSHHFENWGVATWHSGFNAGDSSLIFKAGPPVSDSVWESVRSGSTDAASVGTANLHPDAGSFAWYPNGHPVITMGRTTMPKRTELSNSYTFDAEYDVDPGWSPDDCSEWWSPSSFPSQVGLATNIGQRGEWAFDFGPPESLIDTDAGIDLVDSRRGVTVMLGNFGGAYPVEYKSTDGWWDVGIDRMSRMMVILPEHIVLVIDHIEQSTSLTHRAHFTSTMSSFGISGSSGTISSPDGHMWAVDALSGGSLGTDQLIQRIDQPSGPWVQRLTIANSPGPGIHNHLYVLRSMTQSVSLTSWEPTEEGVAATVTVYHEGTSTTYALRIATQSDPADRSAYLGFSGFMGITPGTDTEIRF